MIQLIAGGVAAYGAAVGALFLLQESMLFPRRAAAVATYPLPRQAERIHLESVTGERLVGTLVRARERSQGVVLAFSGNAWNADDLIVYISHRVRNFDIVCFHYRGYAPSEGEPGEAAFFVDALAIHDWIAKQWPKEEILLAGFSIGTGVAAYVMRERPVRGGLLVTPFDSIEAIARERYPWAPVSRLLRHRFRSDLHLTGRDVPTFVVMASDDQVVPRARTEALVTRLKRPLEIVTVPQSTHNTIYDQPMFDDLLRSALLRLVQAGEP